MAGHITAPLERVQARAKAHKPSIVIERAPLYSFRSSFLLATTTPRR